MEKSQVQNPAAISGNVNPPYPPFHPGWKMTLVHNLAAYNEVPYKYTVVKEEGPKHHITFTVQLKVGQEIYMATGSSIRKAQRKAAAIAVRNTKLLKNYDAPKAKRMHKVIWRSQRSANSNQQAPVNRVAMKLENAIKSPITLIYEFAESVNLNCVFTDIGMTNKKHFLMECRIGFITVQGEGTSKKKSRIACAEKMLVEVKKLAQAANFKIIKKRKPKRLTRNRTHFVTRDIARKSETKLNTDSVTMLNEIYQARKAKGPTYKVIARTGSFRNYIWKMEAAVGDLRVIGLGNSKMSAKQNAADLILQELQKFAEETEEVEKPDKESSAKSEEDMNTDLQQGEQPAEQSPATSQENMNTDLQEGEQPADEFVVTSQEDMNTEPQQDEELENQLPIAAMQQLKM